MFRAVRLAAALLIACLGLVVMTSTPASADCTCKRGELTQQVDRADVIFRGTIDKVVPQDSGFTYDITASRAYVGSPERSAERIVALAEEYKETVNLAVLREEYAVNVDQAMGPSTLATYDWVGSLTPLHATSSGKVLLAALPATHPARDPQMRDWLDERAADQANPAVA